MEETSILSVIDAAKLLGLSEQYIRRLLSSKKITGIFQPHLFSRTKDFADEFAAELAQLDEVVVLDVYPARELPIEGIDAEFLLNKIESKNKRKETKETVLDSLDKSLEHAENGDLLVVLVGAVGIGKQAVVERLEAAKGQYSYNASYTQFTRSFS